MALSANGRQSGSLPENAGSAPAEATIFDCQKVCRKCGQLKHGSLFSAKIVSGHEYLRSNCRKCEHKREKAMPSHKERSKRTVRNQGRRRKEERKDSSSIYKHIYYDARRSDKRHGRKNDLELEFIRAKVAGECQYCGESEIRMTLDRIDNSLGHLKDNVVPCCIRCNYIRGNIPYDAWLKMVPGVREARIAGLFGAWIGGIKGYKEIVFMG